ncbi:electron transport complex protein RnfG [Caldicoprobacter guelmensis]|uniref:RnfABCDGE type electron transport complex subunit G n=1 Tax=Caldicoprobacter guelmensis TaxID=1170224 RepID=UPI00195C3EFE|nr:RnfABCDGE type electron transport complex subunit G [Caldicoprobacter guelmensis]MBM7581734.1 electron transport complex protein RnfG [Caldicoprobacter guelmensis]
MSEGVKMSIKLFIITAVAALALSVTYAVTEEPIRLQNEQASMEARKAVLPDAQEFLPVDISEYKDEYPDVIEVYQGKSGDDVVGYIFRVVSKGYGGNVELFVGIDGKENRIESVSIISHKETPGLGAKATESDFLSQYTGKSADSSLVVVRGRATQDTQVEAITGATITSKAVTQGVNSALEFYGRVLKDGGAER